MLITLDQDTLLTSLQTAQRGISSQSTLPVLSGIKLDARKDGNLSLLGTDLEISIKTGCPANVEKPGSVVIPGKLAVDIVKFLPQGAVKIFLDGEKNDLNIESEKAAFKVKGINPDDFPSFPEVEEKKKVSLDSRQVAEMIKGTSRAVSRDETRPVLTGALLKIEEKTIMMVATDSYRLAIKALPMKGKKSNQVSLLVPLRALEEIAKLVGEAKGKIELSTDENLLKTKVGDVELVTRLIEGEYPNYKQLIPKETKYRAEVNRDEIVTAVKRISLLAQKNMSVKVITGKNKLQIKAATQGVGEASEDIKAKTGGDEVGEMAFNAQYLMDGLQAVNSKDAIIEFTGPVNPGLIRPNSKEDFLYLIMPIRIS